MASVWVELKRRNVVRVAVAYAIVGWLLIEIASTVLPTFEAPQWLLQAFTLFVILGFPIALVFAWAFELTPEGFKREKDVDRSESITEGTGRKLDFLIIGVLAIAVVVLVADRFLFAPDTRSVASGIQPSVAVLPFVDMSPEKNQEYFSDGIAEELLNQLTKLHGLHVAGRTSSFSFKDRDDDLRVIGEKLNVAHILEGSVRKAGDRIRITVQLIKASDGYHLWSQTYDRDLNDIFAIQEETAKAVADALSITLGVGDSALDTGGTRNFEAYDASLAARALVFQQGPENYARAIQLLEKAVRLDPDYADGWSFLAIAYFQAALVFISERADEFLPKGRQAAARAAAIAPEASGSLHAMAFRAALDGDWEQAERNFRKALERAPTAFAINVGYSGFLRAVGRAREAVRYAEAATRIEPLTLTPSLALALTHQTNGDVDKALAEFERGQGLIGNHMLLNGSIVVIALEIDDRTLIVENLDRFENDVELGRPEIRSFTKTMHTGLDSPETAKQELRRAYLDPDFSDPLSQNIIAIYASYFGDYELALKISLKLSERGVLAMDQIWRPIFHGMRELPGFKDLIRDQRLDDYWRATGNWSDFCRPLGHADFECE